MTARTRSPAIRGKPLQFNNANANANTNADDMAEPSHCATEKPAADLHSPPTSPERE